MSYRPTHSVRTFLRGARPVPAPSYHGRPTNEKHNTYKQKEEEYTVE